jgi:hypothetical protein
MLKGKCEAAIVPLNIYKKLDPNRINSKVVYMSRPVSGQAITIGPNLSEKDFRKIRRALLDKRGQAALKNLQTRFASSPLIVARPSEYNGVYSLLESSYGFDTY